MSTPTSAPMSATSAPAGPQGIPLPTRRALMRSTIIALACALLVLFIVVLPAEYGYDPTGLGRPLGLTEMGEIKMRLAKEAAADH